MLGSDVSGVIEALSEGVEGWKIGESVYGMKGMRGGGYAEYTTVLPSEIGVKPRTLSFMHAALTAWHALFTHGDIQAGQRVLVHAAAGGVGHFAIQLAKMAGAHVLAPLLQRTKRSFRKTAWMSSSTTPQVLSRHG